MLVLADARLGRTSESLIVGYEVLTVGRDVFKPWTREDVARVAPGRWAVSHLVEVPDSGGVITWGEQGKTPIAEESFQPERTPIAPPAFDMAPLIALVTDAVARAAGTNASAAASITAEVRALRAAVEKALARLNGFGLDDSEAAVELQNLKRKMASILGIPVVATRPILQPAPSTAAVGEMDGSKGVTKETLAQMLAVLDDYIAAVGGE